MITEITFEELAFLKENNKDVEIESPTGYKDVNKIFYKESPGYTITLDDNSSFKCADTHILYFNNEYRNINDLRVGDFLVDGKFKDYKKVISIDYLPKQKWIDINVNGSCYIQNEVVHHNSGKSLSIFLAVKYYYQNNKNVLLLVPSIMLVSQIYKDFKDYGADFLDDVQQIGGEFKNKDIKRPVVISTWQSAVKSDLKGFDVVLVDEAHQAKAETLNSIIKDNDFERRLGVTGSLPIVEIDAMTLEANFGAPKRYINAKEMIQLGLATDLTVVAMFLNYPQVPKKLIKKYQDEVKYMKESPLRRHFVKALLGKLQGVTVGLYNHTQHGIDTWEDLSGQKMTPEVKNSFVLQQALGIFFITGTTKPKIREQIRVYLNTVKNAVVIAQYNIMSTGINIPRLKNLVYLSSNKSFTATLQSIGRVLRLHSDKEKAFVFDLVDCMSGTRKDENYLQKHFWERSNFYSQEQFELIENEIDLSRY